MMIWTMLHPKMTPEMLGFIPMFLNENDPRGAREQINANYAHGGGWQPFYGFKMLPDTSLKYPGDPPVRLLAQTKLRDEVIRYYEHSWLVVIQPDGSWEASRCD